MRGLVMVTDSVAAVPTALTLNALLVAGRRPGTDALRVYPSPRRSILRSLKVASPATALCVVVPESVPPAGLFWSETEIGFVAPITRAPAPSRIRTFTGGAI